MKQQNTYNPLYNGNVMAMYKREFEIDCSGSDECDNFTLIEQPIYGSSRLGLNKETTLHSSTFSWSGGTPLSYYSNRGGGNVNMVTVPGYADEKTGSEPWDYSRTLGNKAYECSNHLGNVLATVSDRTLAVDDDANDEVDFYLPDVLSVQDYYPFGMIQPGRSYNPGSYRFGFQNQEMDNEIKGVGNHINFKFRGYDTRTGRMWSVDPLAWKYPHNSSYAFSENRVIDGIELEGLQFVQQRADQKAAKTAAGQKTTKDEVIVAVAIASAGVGAVSVAIFGAKAVAVWLCIEAAESIVEEIFHVPYAPINPDITDVADPWINKTIKEIGEKVFTSSEKSAIKGLQGSIETHKQRLKNYKGNPDKHDNQGFLKNATPELREKIINTRIKSLENQIKTFQKDIEAIKNGTKKVTEKGGG